MFPLDKAQLPGSGDDVRVFFRPTRTKITDVSGISRDRWQIVGLSVVLRGPIEATDKPIVVESTGEPLQSPIYKRYPKETVKERIESLQPPSRDGPLKEWYEARERLGRISKAHQFFFELERASEPNVLRHRRSIDEVDDRERQAIEGARASFQDYLFNRLRLRRAGNLPDAPKGNFALLTRQWSSVFLDCAEDLVSDDHGCKDWRRLALALKMFASGELGHFIVVEHDNPPPGIWKACEPDSANVMMFAELALTAIDLEESADTWKLLLPSTICMQRLFFARFPSDSVPRAFGKYGAPELPLQDSARLQIDIDFHGITDRRVLEPWIHSILQCYVTAM